MKRFVLSLALLIGVAINVNSQCTTTNATTCVCATSGVTNCDLLPDMIVGRPPLLINGGSGVVEYSQTGNGVENGRLRISVSTPNIGLGPLEVRGTTTYVCGTDTVTGTAPATCPNTGLPPKQLLVQRVYHKDGNAMSFYDRAAGTMTFHPTHGHQHVDDWGLYTLRTQTNDPNPLNWPIVGTGAKLSFCLLDLSNCTSSNGHCVDANNTVLTSANMPNYGLGGGQYGCSQTLQGISAGYVDIYNQSLDGMYITIPPGTCNGQYYIVVQLDPNNNFLESDESNNVIAVPFTLTKQAGTVPTVSVSGSTSICPGGSVVLTSSPAPSYLWSTGETTQSITVTTAGIYSVTADAGSSCSASSLPVTVTVQSLPVSAAPVSGIICEGQSTTINTTVTTPPNGNAQTSFTNNNIYNIPDNDAAGVSAPLTVSGINPATLSASSIVSVQVNITHTYTGDLVLALIAPSGNTINLSNRRGAGGDNFNNTIFSMTAGTAIAAGSPPFNGSYIPDGAFSALTGNINGTWTLKVTDLAGVDIGTINSWTITLNNLVTTQLAYSWTSSPSGFTSADPNAIVSPTGNTTYTVLVTNLITGCSGTATATVNVDQVNLNVSSNSSICEGSNTTLSASGANTYSWSPATGLNATTGSTVIASPVTTTTYALTGTSSNGCTAIENVTVTVIPLPVLTTSSNATICAGSSATLNVNGADTYNWSPSTGLNTTTGVSVIANPAATTTYTVIGANAFGCVSSADITVTVNPLPVVTLANFSSICSNAALLTLSGGAPAGGSYSGNGVSNGQFNPATAGVGTHAITYAYTNGNGCAASATKNITVNNCNCVTPGTPGPIAGAAKVCAGGTVTYTVNNNPNVTTYNWMMPATATILSGQGTNSVTVQFAGNFTSGSICVTATNACGTSQARCKAISKTGTISIGNMAGNLYGNCNTTVNLSVPANALATSYTWTVPASCTIVSGQGTNAIVLSSPAGFVSGQVCVTAFNGCVTSAARCANIYGAPQSPAAISGPASVCAGQTGVTYSVPVMFSANNYKWTVPAGSTIVSGQGTNTIVVNFGTTAGKIGCTAKNDCGDRGTKTLTIAFNCRLDDQRNDFGITLVPNPAFDKTELHILGNIVENSSLIVTNILGKDVYKQLINLPENGIIELDLDEYAKGIYLVSLQSGNTRRSIRLIVN
jgi:subtilisin-like proprotein convertase family protein